MNITRDIVKDLLPAYLSGEASADTRRAVEEYLRTDPALERETLQASRTLHGVHGASTSPPDSIEERTALQRVKRILRAQRILFALALTFTLNAFTTGLSFDIRNGRTRIQWLAIPGQGVVVLAVVVVALVLWAFYFRASRHVRRRILG